MKLFPNLSYGLAMISLLAPVPALAATASPSACPSPAPAIPPPGCVTTVTQQFFRPGSTNSANGAIDTLWTNTFHTVYIILGALAVFYLMWAGIQYVTSGGSPEKAKKARQTIINVVLGIVVLVASYTIISVLLGLANGAADSVSH